MTNEFKKVAPDGGWGWMVVLALAVSNFITIPIFQNFGMLYRDGKNINIIINTNSAFGYILGFINGPLIRKLGYRKVAATGALMMFVGLFVTSIVSSSYLHDDMLMFYVIFVFYGLINSLGIGWSMASYHLALSTFFVKNRAMAMGVAMTVTGLGPVLMPLVISKLIEEYGIQGTTLILSGLILNTVCTAMLLQPIKWHRKTVMFTSLIPLSQVTHNEEDHTTANGAGGGQEILKKDEIQIQDDDKQQDSLLKDNKVEENKKINKRWHETLVETFDLDLLKDPAFVSMCVGMSIALAADINFSLSIPLILDDYGYDINTTATVQSVVGVADIVSRLLTPIVFRGTKISSRFAYLGSLFCLIITRFCLTLSSDKKSVMTVVFLFGISKGVRTVFMPLVIPNYVPLNKLASANGLQNMLHGIILMMLGPLTGYLRTKTGNYILCVHVLNFLTVTTILLWALEFVCLRKKKNTFTDNNPVER